MDKQPADLIPKGGPSTEEIEKRWNKFCFNYSEFGAKYFRASALQMFDFVQAQKSDVILEMGCGDGTATIDFALMKRKDAKLICNDIARNMCIITVGRLRHLAQLEKSQSTTGYRDKVFSQEQDLSTIQFVGEAETVTELNTTVVHGNNEQLGSHVADMSVDTLIASLSLHIVSSPQAMLQESFRLLKHGGQAIYSVWGQRDNSYQFVSVEKTKEKFGIPPSTKRNSWHLNNKEALIQMVTDAGFVDVLAWEQFIPFIKADPATRKQEYRYLLEVDWTENLRDKLDEAVEYLFNLQEDVYNRLHFPVGLNLLYVTGRKP